MSNVVNNKIIRDKAFAKRLEIACENHAHSPSGHGRQSWLREQLIEKFAVRVSPEAVRKWFAGEARPKVDFMSKVAQTLEVDEAWLSLGLSPAATPREKSKQNAIASGFVNLVAAHIQISGGNIAFPDSDNSVHDISAIVHGKMFEIDVRNISTNVPADVSVPLKYAHVIVVAQGQRENSFTFLHVPESLIRRFGRGKGGYVTFKIDKPDKHYTVGGEPVSVISTFTDLNGKPPRV